MRYRYYILSKDKEPIVETDPAEYIRFNAIDSNTRVGYTSIDGVNISTVFLGLDHRFYGDDPPILFETMIFGGEHNEFQERYCTWEEAERGHQKAVKMVKGKKS